MSMIDKLWETMQSMPKWQKPIIVCHPDNVAWVEQQLARIEATMQPGNALVRDDQTFDIKPFEHCPVFTEKDGKKVPAVYIIKPVDRGFMAMPPLHFDDRESNFASARTDYKRFIGRGR